MPCITLTRPARGSSRRRRRGAGASQRQNDREATVDQRSKHRLSLRTDRRRAGGGGRVGRRDECRGRSDVVFARFDDNLTEKTIEIRTKNKKEISNALDWRRSLWRERTRCVTRRSTCAARRASALADARCDRRPPAGTAAATSASASRPARSRSSSTPTPPRWRWPATPTNQFDRTQVATRAEPSSC